MNTTRRAFLATTVSGVTVPHGPGVGIAEAKEILEGPEVVKC
jgi:hypothetical protein